MGSREPPCWVSLITLKFGQGQPSLWRRTWQPTPVLLPGESHGQRSLAGHNPTGSQRVGHDLATSSSSSSLLWWDHWLGLEGCKAKVIIASNCSFGLLSCQVTSQDKAPSVISRVLKKNNRDSAVASEYELVQLLPGERGQGLGGRTDPGGEGCPPVAVLPHPGGRAGMTALDTSL